MRLDDYRTSDNVQDQRGGDFGRGGAGVAGAACRQPFRDRRYPHAGRRGAAAGQADCYAGVWAARNRTLLEPGDVEERMTAADAIGDAMLQRAAGRRPVPESFTHGTCAERRHWLRRGLETSDPQACDTFDAMGIAIRGGRTVTVAATYAARSSGSPIRGSSRWRMPSAVR